MTTYTDLLTEHQPLMKRCEASRAKSEAIRLAIAPRGEYYSSNGITVFVVGSIGREEVGAASDVDMFLISATNQVDVTTQVEGEALQHIASISGMLGYDANSFKSRYFKLYSLDRMIEALGAPKDDEENQFTARMLLLLESKCVCNTDVYSDTIERVIDHYFRDSHGKKSFRPLFLLNDLLRYWRTLCLNYERIRNEPEQPWWKKNINLKYSRMLTVFGSVLPMVANVEDPKRQFQKLVSKTPLERFSFGLDLLADNGRQKEFATFLDQYEYFLMAKEAVANGSSKDPDALMSTAQANAPLFSTFIYNSLCHDSIPEEFRRFLVQ